MKIIGWIAFVGIQLVSGVFTALGWVLLIPFCLLEAWEPVPGEIIAGYQMTRTIDRWCWKPLNRIYGNPEDGVSGTYALIWKDGRQVPYMATAWPPWRAYCWSALRNSCDALKYLFHWQYGPFVRIEPIIRIRKFTVKLYFQAGWNASGLPGLSFGRV